MNFKFRFSLILVAILLFAASSVAYANNDTVKPEFGDIICSDEGITVFYGNPYENPELAKEIEEQASNGPAYNTIWVDAYSSANKTIGIPASTSYSLTYYTIGQVTESPLERSYVYVYRPDGSVGFIWEMNSGTQEIGGRKIGTTVLPSSAYKWTSGTLKLRWDVETGASGARMNFLAW